MKNTLKLVSLVLVIAALLPSLLSCNETKGDSTTAALTTAAPVVTTPDPQQLLADSVNKYLYDYADLAFENMVKNYWRGSSPESGRFVNSESHIFWEFTMAMLGFETMYKVTGNEDIKKYINTQFNFWLNHFEEKWITYAGGYNNPAADDAAWTAMAMMLCFYHTGNAKALKICAQTIRNAYDFWAHPDGIENGIYYRKKSLSFPDNEDMTLTLYSVGLIYSALRYHELTKGTSAEDKALYEDTLALYNWIEEHLLRDGSKKYDGVQIAEDYIYYNDFTDDPAKGIYRPSGLYSPNGYGCSSLFGNTGMACIHKKLYELTGEQKYLDRAVRTANAIAQYYDYNGTLINDRDAWTDAAFIGYFTSEVMPLEGVDRKLGRTFMKTVYSIMNNCYYDNRYYGGHWNDARDWYSSVEFGNPMTIMTSATTTHIIYAAALAAKQGLIDYQKSDLTLFEKGITSQKLSEEMFQSGAGGGWYQKLK